MTAPQGQLKERLDISVRPILEVEGDGGPDGVTQHGDARLPAGDPQTAQNKTEKEQDTGTENQRGKIVESRNDVIKLPRAGEQDEGQIEESQTDGETPGGTPDAVEHVPDHGKISRLVRCGRDDLRPASRDAQDQYLAHHDGDQQRSGVGKSFFPPAVQQKKKGPRGHNGESGVFRGKGRIVSETAPVALDMNPLAEISRHGTELRLRKGIHAGKRMERDELADGFSGRDEQRGVNDHAARPGFRFFEESRGTPRERQERQNGQKHTRFFHRPSGISPEWRYTADCGILP